MNKEEKKVKKADYEDIALKTGMQYFGETILPFLGIEEAVLTPLPTESVRLEIRRQAEDFNYKTGENKILHFEFQSKNGGKKDLRRFRSYEVALADTYGMEVITYVIFSGNVRNPMTSLKEGINTYQVVPVTLRNKDADEIFEKIRKQTERGEALGRTELVPLTLTPLMGGASQVKDRIKEAFQILKKEEEQEWEETGKLQAMLYAFASKFLKGQELKEIKEVVGMTELGEMLMEEGIKRGRQQGLERGMEQGTERVNRLIQALLKQGKTADIERAVCDREYQEKLFQEFGL